MLSAGRIVDQHASFFDLPGVATILPRSKEFFQFACQARRKTREHCRATSQHDVLNQRDEVINFIGFETLIEFFSKACIFYASKLGIKHAFSRLEALATNFDYLVIWKFVLLVKQGGLIGQFAVFHWVV